MSLNNRVSIRDSMALRGAIRPPAGSFPSSGRSDGTADIVLMDLEKSGKAHPLGEREEAHGSVISEYRSNDASNLCSTKRPLIADIA